MVRSIRRSNLILVIKCRHGGVTYLIHIVFSFNFMVECFSPTKIKSFSSPEIKLIRWVKLYTVCVINKWYRVDTFEEPLGIFLLYVNLVSNLSLVSPTYQRFF